MFVATVVALDQGCGRGLGMLYDCTETGESGGLINGTLRSGAEVLILGSSRARHHIMPAILAQDTPGRIFNGGVNGQDFLYASMLLDLWSRQNVPPRLIVLHLDPQSLTFWPDELQKANVFSAFYDEGGRIRETLLQRGAWERVKYLSRSYRFNGKVLPILKNLLMGGGGPGDGFVGLSGSLSADEARSARERTKAEEVAPPWEAKVRFLDQIVEYCRVSGTRLVLVHSPVFAMPTEQRRQWLDQTSRMAAAYGDVTFLDLSEVAYPELFGGRAELFRDTTHLNQEGAIVFSKLLGRTLAALPAN